MIEPATLIVSAIMAVGVVKEVIVPVFQFMLGM